MAWNGAGVFSRIYNWVNDRDASIPITASRMDAEQDSMAAGINACLTKNGENSPTADLPMSGQKHTGVGNASARDQYAAAGQVQDSSFTYQADGGAADAYTIGLAPAITAYAAGQTFRFKAANANTGASTLNVNSVGAKSIVTRSGAALSGGEILSGAIVTVTYDGTNFQISDAVFPASQAGVDAGTSTTEFVTPATLSGTTQTISGLTAGNATTAANATNLGGVAAADYARKAPATTEGNQLIGISGTWTPSAGWYIFRNAAGGNAVVEILINGVWQTGGFNSAQFTDGGDIRVRETGGITTADVYYLKVT